MTTMSMANGTRTKESTTPSKMLRRSASSMAEALARKDKFVHNTTAQERFRAQVREHLVNVMVRQIGGSTFGLRRCEHVHHSTQQQQQQQQLPPGVVSAAPIAQSSQEALCEECLAVEEDQARVAGWLCLDQSSKAVTRAVRGASSLLRITHDDWDRRYVVFEPSKLSLRLYKTMGKSLEKNAEAEVAIDLATLESVAPVAFVDKTNHRVRFAIRLVYRDSAHGASKLRTIQLKGIEDGDIDLTARWAALLLFRSGLYSEDLDDLSRIVHRGITKLQRAVRPRVRAALAEASQGSKRSSRRRHSLRGGHVTRFLPNMLRPFLGRQDSGTHSDPGTDVEEIASEPGTPTARTPRLIQHGRSQSLQIGPTHCADTEAARWVVPLAEGEEEDEIWENQRWSFLDLKDKRIKRGWSGASLLPQERKPFTNRIGHGLGRDLDEVEAALPVPPGWEITTPFIVDMSGVSQSRCDAEGWRYESQFNALDSKQAKGSQRGQANARWVVRQRRWYRRRKPVSDAPEQAARTPSWVAAHGWLGMRGMSTGVLWRSRYAMIVMPKDLCSASAEDCDSDKSAPRPGGINVAFWAYFTKDLKGHGAVTNLYDVDWASLPDKLLHIKPLDRSCSVSDRVATVDHPGYFELHLSGESKPRMLNAETRENRVRWIRALREAIAASHSVLETMDALQSTAAFFDDTSRNSDSSRMASPHGDGGPSNFELSSRRRIRTPLARTGSGLGMLTVRRYLKRHEDDSGPPMGQDEEFANGDGVPADEPKAADGEAEDAVANPEENTSSLALDRSGSGSSNESTTSATSTAVKFSNLSSELFELSLSVDVDTLVKLMFVEPEFQQRLDSIKEYTHVVRTAWTVPGGEEGFTEGARCKSSYTIPKKGPVPETRAFSTFTCRKILTGKGYQVEKSTMNPSIPCGTSFRSVLRFNLEAESESATRLVISHEVVFLEHVVMRAFIRAATLREVRTSYKKATLELESFLQSRNLGSGNFHSQLAQKDGTSSADLGTGAEAEGDGQEAQDADQGNFTFPDPYENVIIDGTLDADVDTVHRILHLDRAFGQRMFELDKAENITVSDWSQGNTAGSTREMQYLIPRKGPIPRNTCYASWEIVQAVPRVGFHVDQEVRNPEVPYGKTFATLLRLALEAASPTSTRIQVSHHVDFRQSTMMKGFIKSSSSREIKKNFESQWFPELQRFVAQEGGKSEDAGSQPTTSGESSDASEKAVFKPQAEPAHTPQPWSQYLVWLLAFVQLAMEVEKTGDERAFVIAYYCRTRALELALACKRSPEDNAFLGVLMDMLEEKKKEEPTLSDTLECEDVIRSYAKEKLTEAENEYMDGAANKNTARRYYAAASFFEVLATFSPDKKIDDATKKSALFAKWRATEILKAIKEGRPPVPSEEELARTRDEEDGEEDDEEDDDDGLGMLPPPAPTGAPAPRGASRFHDDEEEEEEEEEEAPRYKKPSRTVKKKSSAKQPPKFTSNLADAAKEDAMEYTRYALRAIELDDIEMAKQHLESALRELQ
ncbi:Vacuolar protein sorting-associated protein VTA1-like [Hondaea fermentalgiana]|uniref:Vacuolar protein sorting-associated protein VTA1-like n=1 Tax=Hondaea fermentalgiana TaxID=2315210 RepID=A0A2R5GU77_9STRA|nr:Vacuolar protein sorting-associated protein VTA1-like [Hondaea fermentalgiana]|eukprot:GBG31941.1 Vacuolar protein sorting-associated protein VTA1-like [Hondaea fermentalgiana]